MSLCINIILNCNYVNLDKNSKFYEIKDFSY